MGGRQTFRILIIGKSGSGKSTLARQIVQGMEGRFRRLQALLREEARRKKARQELAAFMRQVAGRSGLTEEEVFAHLEGRS